MQWFVENPLLTLFFCLGVGSLFGRIRFGPVAFGPAGALFVALALAAIEPDVALPPIVTSLSLCVFCYMVGLAAGPSFVSAIRTGWKQVVVSVLAIMAMAATALGLGWAFGLDIGTVAGAFAGAGTATPALGAVQQQLAVGDTVPPEPAIGYAVAYPITVCLTILACSYLMSAGRRTPNAEDRAKVPPIVVQTVELLGDPGLDVRGLETDYHAVVSRLTRNGKTGVAHDDERLAAGDLLTVTATDDQVQRLIKDLGRLAQS
ncbi:aspartate-alanine antiporter-like transporter, partial [Mycolicibacterium vaccae]